MDALNDDAPIGPDTRTVLVKEASTMALYVSVSLLAALTALAEADEQTHPAVLGVVWGTTMGLAVAHLFAFRVSAKLVAQGSFPVEDRIAAAGQLAGAAAVAALCTGPVLWLPSTAELDVARIALALFVAAVGYVVAHAHGSSRSRAILYGVTLFVVAVVVALLKNVLSGH